MIDLHCGDCIDIADRFEPGDVLITDPPYGYMYSNHKTDRESAARWNRTPIAGDAGTAARDRVLALFSVFAVFGNIKSQIDDPRVRGVLVWDKGLASGMGDWAFPWRPNFEFIFVGGPGWRGHRDSSVIRASVASTVRGGRTHPNDKPVALAEHLIAKAPPGRIVDPFMGTGAIGVAAMRQGREFMGAEIDRTYFEIDRTYFEIAADRINAARDQVDLFACEAAS